MKKIQVGQSDKRINANIKALMKLGYSYPAAVKAAKALTGPNAVAENPISQAWLWGLGAAAALGVGYLFWRSSASTAITPASSGQTITAKVGDVIPISLPAPKVGYKWDGGPQGTTNVFTWSSPQVAADGSVTNTLRVIAAGSQQLAAAQFDSNNNPDPTTEFLVTITAS